MRTSGLMGECNIAVIIVVAVVVVTRTWPGVIFSWTVFKG